MVTILFDHGRKVVVYERGFFGKDIVGDGPWLCREVTVRTERTLVWEDENGREVGRESKPLIQLTQAQLARLALEAGHLLLIAEGARTGMPDKKVFASYSAEKMLIYCEEERNTVLFRDLILKVQETTGGGRRDVTL